MRLKSLFCGLILTIAWSGVANAKNACARLFLPTLLEDTYAKIQSAALNRRLKNNRFQIHRGLRNFHGEFGNVFIKALARENAVWWDIGAGSGLAQIEVQTKRLYEVEKSIIGRVDSGALGKPREVIRPLATGTKNRQILEMVSQIPPLRTRALAFIKPDTATAAESFLDRQRVDHQYFEGKLEFLDISGFEKATLLTDFYGALSYTRTPSLVLAKELEMLDSGGTLLIVLADFGTYVTIKEGHLERDVEFSDWVVDQLAPHGEILRIKKDIDVKIVFKKSVDPSMDVRISPVRLTRLVDRAPPLRYFEELGP